MTQPTLQQPWTDYPALAGYTGSTPYDRKWDTANWPYVVRWNVSYPDRLTRSVSNIREFCTLEEAVAAYKRPFKGISVDLVKYNGKPNGQHLDRLAYRKAGKATKWDASVPAALRAA